MVDKTKAQIIAKKLYDSIKDQREELALALIEYELLKTNLEGFDESRRILMKSLGERKIEKPHIPQQ